MLFLIISIHTSRHCNPLSNVDFLHFIWDNYRRFSFEKYAITLLPSTTLPLPQMLCLQYYRTKSDEWKDYGNCDDCVQENISNLCPLSRCRQPDVCSCNIYKRQLPSPVHLANHVLLNYTLTLKRFSLTADITYQQYVYAVRSGKVVISNLLPPEYPSICLWFRCQQDSPYRFHRDCPGLGIWHSGMDGEYESFQEVLSDLIRLKDQFWCNHCERGLFFPKTCTIHSEVKQEEEEIEEED